MRVIGVIAALAIAWTSPARADDQAIADARAALDKSDYLGAREALVRALGAGDNDRDALVEIYRMTGIVAGALGEAAAATDAFERLLSLAPKAELPAGTSPKIARPFATAKANAKKAGPLEVEATTSASPPAVTVTIASDPARLVERVRAIARVDGGREEINEQPADATVVIELRAGDRVDVWVVALDAHGNRLAEVGSADVPLVIVGTDAPPPGDGTAPAARPPPAEPAGPRAPRPLYAKWWLWGGVAVAFAGAAGYFAYDARAAVDELNALNADSSNHRFTEAQAVERRAERDVLFANIGFAVAGAAAVAATILLLTEPDAPRRTERASVVAPVPLAGGGGVVLEVPF